MDTYSFLRELADSWVLLAMFCFFAGAAIWAVWPGHSGARQDASMIPFRNDVPKKTCTGQCVSCKSTNKWEDRFDV
jgi:cytochrome c oxidase cbb3-type subunit 4